MMAIGTTSRKAPLAGWVLAVMAASVYVGGVSAQTVPQQGYPQDWSHRHLVFSNPGTYQQAVQKGTANEWLKITGDPRYIIQQRARSGAAAGVPASNVVPVTDSLTAKKGKIKKDWSASLSGVQASKTGTVGTLSGGISGSSTLTVDLVTFDASAPVAASATGTFTNGTAASGSVTITNGSNSLTLAPGTASTASITFSSSRPSSGSTVTIGGVTYTFETSLSSCSANEIYSGGSSSSNTTAISNLVTVLNGAGTAGSTTYCAGTTTPNYGASGATGTNKVTLTNNIAGSGQNGTTAFTSSSSYFGLEMPNWAGGSGSVGFVASTNATMEATSLAAAIAADGGTEGVTATSSGAVVTVTAAAAGTGGNSIQLTDSLTEFSWSGSTLVNGADGTTSGTASPPTFAYWSVNNYLTPTQVAANIASAINANTTLQTLTTGVFATSSGANVTITARQAGTGGNSYAISASSFSAWSGTGDLANGASTPTGAVQPNAFPAKYSFTTTGASCSDFVVYPTGTKGGTGQASIIAYNNLYSGCSGAVPSVYWAYNTGAGYSVTTSPVLSLDGTQVAFMQSNGSAAQLVLLTWAASTTVSLNSPTTLTSTTASGYQNCTGPCMYATAFNDSHEDTLSAPFYDYHGDALYVGDDSGSLHQFTGVFNGVPAESGGSWPVSLGSSKLAPPVYDGAWNGGVVFVRRFEWRISLRHCGRRDIRL